MRRPLPAVTAAVLAAVAVVAAMTGCTPEPPETETIPEQNFDDHSSALEEYEAAAAEYELPAGQTYPPAPFDDESGIYETGYGESVVVTLWNCAWGREYLLLRGENAEAASAALEQYASLMETEAYDLYYDPASVHPVFESAIENARLGDPALVQSLVEGGCP